MLDELRLMIRSAYLEDEDRVLARLIDDLSPRRQVLSAAVADAVALVEAVRKSSHPRMMEAFLGEYGLSTREGVALMCLAEALLRVPDAPTMDDLIRDKIAPHDWSAHSGGSSSIFVNASTWALALTGRVLDEEGEGIEGTLRTMLRRLGEPVIRRAVAAAMKEMGDQFVLGQTIDEALKRGRAMKRTGYLYSYDMLGEAARTEADAARYHEAYSRAIARLAGEAKASSVRLNPGISVKLSALHPRYEYAQRDLVVPQMVERLGTLVAQAAEAGIGLNIDAEEADRLDLSLDIIEKTFDAPALRDWDGLGIVVQAYGRRAAPVIDWIGELARSRRRRLMVRLVKGAYWDTEIKRAQTLGLDGYPVFTRKENTDVSYLACAARLIGMDDRIFAQFATHNAHTTAAIIAMRPDPERFEFQRLHGMGEALHEELRKRHGSRCRIYAPVGAHEDLLAYLVRRLLENGANSSFVHQIVDLSVPADAIARDPLATVETRSGAHNAAIPMPFDLYGPVRRNAAGWDLTDPLALERFEAARAPFATAPLARPADASPEQVQEAIAAAAAAQPQWASVPVAERAACLRRAADLFERNAGEIFALCAREAGKTPVDAVAELREAVDFLRYYAGEAETLPRHLSARGTVVCISPWNFPLAIFTGQVAAALATGNAVLAKPAEQTPIIASRAVDLLHEAGVPHDVLHLLAGDGPSVGAALVASPSIDGVCFTGSTDTARRIERQLAESAPPDAMLIAETGGLNAMIVDSTALPEQAVRDILASAFQSAGQRCSALRILYVQADVEERIMAMLKGAMQCLRIGNPWLPSTDLGPVIDDEAFVAISNYCADMTARGALVAKLDVPAGRPRTVAPHIFRVSGIGEMDREIFGPVLHVARFEAEDIGRVIADINAAGYGLTFGLHTRIEARVQEVVDAVHAGNVYVNRNQIGAVVGAQPFGGEGLSGTGPKAGGPNYLRRFCREVSRATEAATALPHASVAEALPAFPDASAWRVRTDRFDALRRLLRGRAADALRIANAVDPGPLDLPGPTGEANTLALAPRGNTLCLGADAESLLAQVVQALSAGNAVIAVAPDAPRLLAPLLRPELPLVVLDGTVATEMLADLPLALVAASGPEEYCRSIRRSLARRKGAIVRLVTEIDDPVAYWHERAVCVDTTAAGGNASLLASA